MAFSGVLRDVWRWALRPVFVLLVAAVLLSEATAVAVLAWAQTGHGLRPAQPVETRATAVLAAASDHPDALQIVALGDSYMSGEGTGSYLAGTDRGPAVNSCRRSPFAYPVLLANNLRDHPVTAPDGTPAYSGVHLTFAACSGATTVNIGSNFTDPDAHPVKQFPQVDLQIESLEEHPNADVVLLSVGGNDAGFSKTVLTCSGHSTSRTCEQLAGPWLETVVTNGKGAPVGADGLTYLLPKLRDVMDQIRTIAPHARYYVTTYPMPTAATSCHRDGLSEAEVNFLRDVFLPAVNRVIEFAGLAEGFELVDLTDALQDRGLCTGDDGTNGDAINGWLGQLNDDFTLDPNQLLRGSFHPTAAGHALMEQILEAQVREGLSRPAPNVPAQDECPGIPPGVPGGPPTPPPNLPPPPVSSSLTSTAANVPSECAFPDDLPPSEWTVMLGVYCNQGGITWECSLPRPGEPTPSPPIQVPGGPPPGLPPTISRLRDNHCVAERDVFYDDFAIEDHPTSTITALPGSSVCVAKFEQAWTQVPVGADGTAELDQGDVVGGLGGRRDVLYRSAVDGQWVWQIRWPEPTTAPSTLNEFEAWTGSRALGGMINRIHNLPAVPLLAVAVVAAYLIGLGLDRRIRQAFGVAP